MITVSNARKNYGDFVALDDVSLEIPSGSLTALLGPSGSGKSTLLRAIAGLEGLDSGVVSIGGVDVTREPPQKRGIGFVFQHYAAFKHMTVRDNVAFGLTIRKRPKAEVRRKVDELLEIVGLDGFQHRYPAQLSGGQRQRMALARALAVDPQVLLLDEPFGALDAKVRADLRHWLRRLHDEVHVTTVLVTHDQEEALDVADRIAVLNKGRIEQVGDPVSLYERPANDFVMSFLGSVARLGGQLVRPHDIVLERDRVAALAVDARIAGSPGVVEAAVERVVRLGFEVRVELRADSGERFAAQVTRARGRPAALRAGRDGLRPGRAPRRRHRRRAGARDLRATSPQCAVECARRQRHVRHTVRRGHLRAHRVRRPGDARARAGPGRGGRAAQRRDPRAAPGPAAQVPRGDRGRPARCRPRGEHPRGPRRLHPGATGIRGQPR